MSDRSHVLPQRKRAHMLWFRRFRDDPVSRLPTPFSMLFRLIATMGVAIGLALAINYLADRIGG